MSNRTAYQAPLYYEIAFSFFDVKKQVDFFQELFEKFSQVKVRKVLDVGCGPSLQLRELAKRGYDGIGLDLNQEMLDYLKEKAREDGLRVRTEKADMWDFRLSERVDFAFVMMGTLNGGESNKQFLNHLDSVADCLKPGGLYFIQNFPFIFQKHKEEKWEIRKENIHVKTTFTLDLINPITQQVKEVLVHEIKDAEKREKYREETTHKLIYPQEFKLLIEKNREFEFLGWHPGTTDTWDLKTPLEEAEDPSTNMILLRKL